MSEGSDDIGKLVMGCPECDYSTRFWDIETAEGSRCPVCVPEAAIDDLRAVSGVGRDKAEALARAGFETIRDLHSASQEDLANVEGIGMALAARIKADVGDGTQLTDRVDDRQLMEEFGLIEDASAHRPELEVLRYKTTDGTAKFPMVDVEAAKQLDGLPITTRKNE